MYKIYANKICIHNGLSQDPTIKATEATLTEEDNRSGSLEFKITPSNIGYKSIIPMATTIVVNKVDSDTLEETSIWVGRATQKDIDFYNCESCYCEGALSFLVDTFQEKETFEGTVAEYFEKLLSTHNKKVSQNRRIKLGTIQADLNLTIKVDLDYANTLECINTGVIEPLKGHIEIEIPTNYTSSTFENSPTLNYYKDWKSGTSQNIDFGKNLLDMTRNFDVTDLVTAIYPRGASITDENGVETVVDISSVNDGSKILINEELRSKYGYIEKVVDFSDIEDPQKLLEAARTYFTDSQFDDMSIEVSAFDMSYLRFGQQTEEVYSPFRLLEKVHCISTPHGLDREFPITKIVTDLLDPVRSVITLNSSKGNDLSAMGGGSITVNNYGSTIETKSDEISAWAPAIDSTFFYNGVLSITPTNPTPAYYGIIHVGSKSSSYNKMIWGDLFVGRAMFNGANPPSSATPYCVVMYRGYVSQAPVKPTPHSFQNYNGLAIFQGYDYLTNERINTPAIHIVTKTNGFRYNVSMPNVQPPYNGPMYWGFELRSDAELFISKLLSDDFPGLRSYTYISQWKEINGDKESYGISTMPSLAVGLLTMGDIKNNTPIDLNPEGTCFDLIQYSPSLQKNTYAINTNGMVMNGVLNGEVHAGRVTFDSNGVYSGGNVRIGANKIEFSTSSIFFSQIEPEMESGTMELKTE